MQVQLTILGAKNFSGEVEGQKYDHTKLIISLPFPKARAESNIGYDAQEATYGTSLNFVQFKGRQFPIKCNAEVEITTRGMDIINVELPPVQAPKAS